MNITICIQRRRNESGTVTLIVVALIAVMTLLVMVNTRALYTLKREIRLIEKKQLQHWTNSPPFRATTIRR